MSDMTLIVVSNIMLYAVDKKLKTVHCLPYKAGRRQKTTTSLATKNNDSFQ